MVDAINGLIDDIRREKQYSLDIETMEKYYVAYGFDKNCLAFSLMFPAYVDLRYVQ